MRSIRRQRGFTLLELIIVIAIIGILATVAMPKMKDMPRRASEATLKQNLRTMRDVIDQYYGDKGRYPASLEALVEAGYLRKVPADPITRSSETWLLDYEEVNPDEPAAEADGGDGSPGIVDIHSGSPLKSLSGTPYSEW
ncbi:MAG TPA: prepilin-type N-terminal cleavage/methylation domain-containing protein [Thermoanaerobaculia bacterium]|jgi:type II secretion system protein G|nr:prepilin-type N-terminal cleavage/methylation domain-containing protein [Thermoanaerobaculia bacterium]